MKWIVFNIGCIECGVSSAIVGVFTDEAQAKDVADKCRAKFSWREGGQNEFEAFPLPENDNIVAIEYAGAFK